MSEESVIRRERTELFVGLFILVGLAIMGTLIWQFGKIGDRIGDRYQIQLRLDDASGIMEGSAVRFGGTKIGFVARKDPRTDFTGIVLTLDLDSTYRIPEGSRFAVSTSGLMGDRYINVSPPQEVTNDKIKPGAMVEGVLEDPVKEIQETVMDLSTRANVVLAELDQAIADSQVVVANFTKISEKVDAQVLSDDNLDNFANALDKISLTTDNLTDASAKLEPLIEESRDTVKQAGKPFETADKALVELEPTVKELRVAVEGAQDAIDEANSAIREVTGGEGVTASLITNEELARDLESLIANLEAHGVLGYKKGKRRNDAYEERQERRAEEKKSPSPPENVRPVSADGEEDKGWFGSLFRREASDSEDSRPRRTYRKPPYGKIRR